MAVAFVLLHGNPPRHLIYRNGLFQFRGSLARAYRASLEKFAHDQLPHRCKGADGRYSSTLAVQLRNRCLRHIMGVDP